MKKIVVLLLVAVMLNFGLTVEATDNSAKSAIVFQPGSNTVLYEKNADEQLPVASTTKILTALLVIENCGLDECVEVKPEHTAVEGSSMYLKAGHSYSVRDLLFGLMLASGNDAAMALAEHTSGTIDDFADLMNKKCRELGLENSHFTNPHGLDDAEHYSSARDLAIITAAAMENMTFREFFSTLSYTVNGISYTNHNKLLKSCPGCIGGKTGYTSSAGRVLVSCVEREGMELICVTIADPDDWRDHSELYDWAYENYKFIPALDNDQSLSVISGMTEKVKLETACRGVVLLKDASYSLEVYLPRFVFAPAIAGRRVGDVRIFSEGTEYIVPVYYGENVFLDGTVPLTPLERFKRAWYLSSKYGLYYPQN